jgi:hypothetical protein
MHRTIGDVLELDTLGVQVISVKEPWLDQQGPARSLLLAVLFWGPGAGGCAPVGGHDRSGLPAGWRD